MGRADLASSLNASLHPTLDTSPDTSPGQGEGQAAGRPPEVGSPRFEGSYLGDAHRLPPQAKLECKICWWVYDPTVGDEVWQVPPGTAFADLPAHWRCPQCDGSAEQFMVLPDDAVEGA